MAHFRSICNSPIIRSGAVLVPAGLPIQAAPHVGKRRSNRRRDLAPLNIGVFARRGARIVAARATLRRLGFTPVATSPQEYADRIALGAASSGWRLESRERLFLSSYPIEDMLRRKRL